MKDEYTITIQRPDNQVAPMACCHPHLCTLYLLSLSRTYSISFSSAFSCTWSIHSIPLASSFFPLHTRSPQTCESGNEKDYRRQIWIIKEENYYKVYLPGSTRQQFIYLIFTYSTVTMCGTELLHCIQGLIRTILTFIYGLLYSTYFYYFRNNMFNNNLSKAFSVQLNLHIVHTH